MTEFRWFDGINGVRYDFNKEVKTVDGVNWNKIKREYAAGAGSIKALAEKYGIPYGTLRSRSQKEKWGELKAKTQAKINQELPTAISNAYGEEIKELTGEFIKKLKRVSRELETVAKMPITTKIKATLPDGSTKETVTVSTKEKVIIDRQGLKTATEILEKLSALVKAGEEGENKDTSITVKFEGQSGNYAE